jgi:hypothetical protein
MDDNNKEKLNNNLENKNEENEKNKIENNNENNSNTTNNIIITEEPKNTENNLDPLKYFEINSKKEEEKRKEESEKKVEELKILNNIKIDNEKENENLNINEIKKEMKKVEETKEPIKIEGSTYAHPEKVKIKEMDKNKKSRLMARMMSSQLLSKKKVKLEKKTSEAILKRARQLDSNFNKPEIGKFNPYSEAVKNKNFGIEDNEILQVTEIETKITQPIGPKKIDFAAFMKK